MNKNICAFCSCGIETMEKFCSQCGGPNVNFLDIEFRQSPITNIGARVLEYDINPFEGTYHWTVPHDGILKRIIILTSYPLERVRIIENGSFYLVNQQPRTNEFIYTGEINLHDISDLYMTMETRKKQAVRIILETDPEPNVYYGNSKSFIKTMQGR